MGSANTRAVQYLGQFDMKPDGYSSEPPAVVAMETTSSGGLLVCDKSSMKVSLFDDLFKISAEIQLTSEPYGMALISPREVLVSLPGLQCLQSIELAEWGKLLSKGKIQTDMKCDRILRYTPNLIVLARNEECVHFNIMNTNGQTLRCIRKEPIFPDKADGMFNRVGFIALSADQSVIYVTEMCNGCIGLSVTTGDVLFIYKESQTRFLFGVCTDSEGFVYLTSTDMDRILVINSKGEKVKHVATLKDTSPGYMTFSKQQNRLYIKTVYTNKILMYDVR